MAVSNVLIEEPMDSITDNGVTGYSDTRDKDKPPTDRHLALLAAAHAAIDRRLSRDPVTFLNRHKQARGE